MSLIISRLSQIWLLLLILIVTVFTPKPALSQGLNVAATYLINDNQAVGGDILITSPDGIKRSSISYDSKILGVLVDNPLIVLRDQDPTKKPILSAGEAIVNITDFNGEIKRSDYVTTSPLAGEGMKGVQSGYVVGIALEDSSYNGQTSVIQGKASKLGTVKVAVKIEYAEITTARNNIRLLNDLAAVLYRSSQDPEKFINILRYIIAGLIAIIAFTVGFISTARAFTKTIESLGRNPLAQKSIYTSVAIHVFLTITAELIAFAVIFTIVRL
jgi:F0F1-type ATP synthase membrane subunit c/vacuolar-type H+-ATPase subunit K